MGKMPNQYLAVAERLGQVKWNDCQIKCDDVVDKLF